MEASFVRYTSYIGEWRILEVVQMNPFRNIVSLVAIGLSFLISSQSAAADSAGSNATDAVRLVIEFDRGGFKITSATSVRKTLPPSDEIPDGPTSGWYFELQNADGKALYRRIIHDPITTAFEGPDPDLRHTNIPIRSASVPNTRVFSLVMPAAQPGDEFVLFGAGLSSGADASLQRSAALAASGELTRLLIVPPIQ
jgi:hypothetical protein